ncbi:hypothetical protein, partial [uncultured Desulfovibrio sp.]|uniref:hypothetical protein n=1 Tax=uncultured Desulfovibrio sp. TaxID=167968 RepID=UPI0028064C46
AGKEEKNFRGECTQVLDQENFSLTQPAPKRLFLTDNCGIVRTAQGRHQPKSIITPFKKQACPACAHRKTACVSAAAFPGGKPDAPG